MATVDIIIRGIALCYKRYVGTPLLWRVLFPFDDENPAAGKELCHKLNFTWKKSDGPNLGFVSAPGTKISLAKPRALITIKSEKPISGNSGQTSNFGKHVFDFTNTEDPNKPFTHSNVNLLNIPEGRNWRDGTAVLKIDVPVIFSVDEYLNNLTDEDINAHEDNGGTYGPPRPVNTPLAHSVKATIELATGQSLKVLNGRDVLAVIEGNEPVTLVFDNDCKARRKQNDMDMFYEKTIVDNAAADRRFRIGDRRLEGLDEGKSIPPSLFEGKPCLAAQVSIPDDFPADIPG